MNDLHHSVLVIGSSCVDVIIRVEHLPRREENLHPQSQQFRLGGCACNVSQVLGRGKADMTFVTPVGLQGVFGPWVYARLQDMPWASPVCLEDAANGCCYCLVEPDGERTFLSIHGAEYTFDAAWMGAYQAQSYDFGYVCGLEVEEKTGGNLVAWLETARIGTIMYAPGPRGLRVPNALTEQLLDLHPMLHLNRQETLEMAGCDDLEKAMCALVRRTGRPVITTLGPDGAMVLGPDIALQHVPGVAHVKVVDTIGAGDAHAGAVLLGLSRGMWLADAAAFANRVSARVVAQEGAALEDASVLFP